MLHVVLNFAFCNIGSLRKVCLQVRCKKHVVVIGWDVDQTVEGLLKGLGDFAPDDSSITIISPEKPGDFLEENGACHCRHLEGSIASRQVLLQVSTAQAIMP